MKTVLITGATSGIGKSTAILFAKNKFNLIICGRREDRLVSLKEELSKLVDVEILVFDVKNKSQVKAAFEKIKSKISQIDILINNAGGAHGLDPIYNVKSEDLDEMIDVNVKGLLYVSQEIIPSMVEKKSGTIINLSSIAGKEVYPNGNIYCASKHAVDAITKGMRLDLNPFGIKVASINPGMVETEFSVVRFKGDQTKANNVYKGITPLTPDDIAETLFFMATRPPHVNIADLTIFPTAQASSSIVNRQ